MSGAVLAYSRNAVNVRLKKIYQVGFEFYSFCKDCEKMTVSSCLLILDVGKEWLLYD